MKKYRINGDFYRGKYYKRLFIVFICAAVLFSALCTFLLFITASQILKNEQSAYEMIAQNRYNLIDTSLAVIVAGMDTFVKNPYLAEWADADNANEYYRKAIYLYDYIKSISGQLGALAYEVAVIGERYNTMSISGLGSGPFQWYAENETSLSVSAIKELCMNLPNTNAVAVFPVYDKGGKIREIYFMRKQQWKTQKTFVIFKLFAEAMFSPAENENFYIQGPDNVYISARIKDWNNVLSEKDKRYLQYVYPLHNQLWSLHIELYKNTNIYILLLGMSVVFSIFIFVVCIVTAKHITRSLYYPLGEIISNLEPGFVVHNKKDKIFLDEFEILRNNSRKMELLSEELRKTLEENQVLALQKYNRGLLEGFVSEADKENKDDFFVALVYLTNESDEQAYDRRPYLQLAAETCAIADRGIQYVQYGIKEFALILGCTFPEEAMEKLKNFLTKLQSFPHADSVKIQAALSNRVQGKAALQKGLIHARSVLEFRHTQPHVSILTDSVITEFAPGLYDYPLETERKLLDLLIGGNLQVKDYFDEIIQRNIDGASFSALQNLVYALCGTLLRALQELKLPPGELCGNTVDWASLYTGSPDLVLFNKLKNIAVCIAESVSKKTVSTDAHILQLMRNYICHNFHRDISLQDLSDELNITPKYCSKLFSRLSNNTFKNYLNAFRIERAQEMIRDDPRIKIIDLAGDVGFNSATSFIRVFNRYAGLSPKAYADTVLKNNAVR